MCRIATHEAGELRHSSGSMAVAPETPSDVWIRGGAWTVRLSAVLLVPLVENVEVVEAALALH
jgi:hypothetical protein